ncbi:EAL domain-containing protein [Gemmatimonas aurantiaca]|uniref:putative bifunctional diguanylate cyclase/phosphodiesterase n=1 Tax=Gemmatimonas aurantiaca TaxID=173480 RepID=UPI00301DA0A6
MEGSEELRETIVGMRREIDALRMENTHANLLLQALDAVLCVTGDADPFANVFSALLPVFDASHAIVLVEDATPRDALHCVAANADALVDSRWRGGRTFAKVLSGRVVTTVTGADWEEWPEGAVAGLTRSQPTLYLPLGVRGRRGLLMILREEGRTGFDRAHVTLARKFSVLASHALAAKRASQTEAESHRLKHLTEQLEASQEALTFRANHDQLTGLPNRSHVRELVDYAVSRKTPGEKLALAFIDLDNFKQVNDLYGHAAGDALLKGVAERITAQLRRTDVLGRISGDEFVIMLDPVRQRSETAAVIDRVREQLQQPFRIDGIDVRTSGSIGVAFYPMHGTDYDTLRHHADTAMYRAKSSSKGSITYFSQKMGQEAKERLSLEYRLRRAINERQIQCALQQKVDIHRQSVVGFEALARWTESHGIVHPPGLFVPIAAEMGLLDEMTDIVLDGLIQAMPDLTARFGEDITYSLNLSPGQTARLPFMQKVIQRIVDTARPRNFILEFTEDALVATGPFQSKVLPLLKEADIGVSIDDFGMGYSSLAVLADITADEIKVDRSLISGIQDRPRSQIILRAIESLSSALGVSVVAEGIEEHAEKDYLQRHSNIRIGQGFLFHKPELVTELMDDHLPMLLAKHVA